jgi:hypothetical protein
LDAGEVVVGALVVAGGDASEVLEKRSTRFL